MTDRTPFDLLGPYRKSVAALVAGLVLWGYLVIESGSEAVTAQEWIGLAVVILGAAGVWGVPNVPTKPGK